MKRLLAALASLYLVAGYADSLTGRVVKIADGDTVTVLDARNEQHKVRLAGIDAPERGGHSQRSGPLRHRARAPRDGQDSGVKCCLGGVRLAARRRGHRKASPGSSGPEYTRLRRDRPRARHDPAALAGADG